MSLKTNPKRKIFCQKLVSATVCFREQEKLSQQNSDIKKQNKINCPKKNNVKINFSATTILLACSYVYHVFFNGSMLQSSHAERFSVSHMQDFH